MFSTKGVRKGPCLGDLQCLVCCSDAERLIQPFLTRMYFRILCYHPRSMSFNLSGASPAERSHEQVS